VKKSYKTKIRGLTKNQFDRLKELSNIAKNLYNQALYILREEFVSTQKYISYPQMDKIMKQTLNLENNINYKLLKAGVSQQILKKLDKNFVSFFKSIKECVNNNISTVVIGNVANANNKINLGKKTNQNFVNISLGQFVAKLKYKLEFHNISVEITDESYTSKASFIDNDKLPKKHDINKKFEFSGTRIKRGLYKPLIFTNINADVNGAYNIIRKVVSNFTFEELSKRVNDEIAGWFLPHIKIVDLSMKVNGK